MKKSNFYKYALFFLIALNIALLSFVIISKPQPQRPPFNGPNNPGPGSFMNQATSILRLDKAQADSFSELAKKHKQDMDLINKEEATLISEYFESLTNNFTETHSDSLLQLINDANTKKLTVTFKHFEDIKSLLRDEQKSNFNRFMDRALNNILNNKGNTPPPPKGF